MMAPEFMCDAIDDLRESEKAPRIDLTNPVVQFGCACRLMGLDPVVLSYVAPLFLMQLWVAFLGGRALAGMPVVPRPQEQAYVAVPGARRKFRHHAHQMRLPLFDGGRKAARR